LVGVNNLDYNLGIIQLIIPTEQGFINFTPLQLFLRRPKRTLKKILDIAFEA
jgi:hypothetical protein